jgi:divalent metal cation (Fe/Co/Zn/Cd) transporter
LLGESAAPDAQRKIAAALESTDGFERIIHLKTLHLGPEELLVAAKVGVVRGISAEELAAAINAAETAVREAEPLAQVIYLEPDIYREDYVPAERPQPPEPVGH